MAAYPQSTPSHEAPGIASGPRPSILVVDDDPSLVRILKKNLEFVGYEVTCVFDGMHAIHVSRERHFDLIILDINMPITNGFKVLEYLRTRPATAKTPVIIVTGEPSSEVYPVVARDPRASFIKKPLDIESLNS